MQVMHNELLIFVYRNQPTRYSVEAGITRVSANGETRTVTKVNLVSTFFNFKIRPFILCTDSLAKYF